MSVPELRYCPGTLKEGYNTYSPSILRNVFNGKQVSHILPYRSPRRDADTDELFMENRKRISISGVQEKLSLIQDKNKLRLTELGELGTHILKPIPVDLKIVEEVPANEQLTMQIAAQVYGIKTAANALIFFKDGEPAYITKRFDVRGNGTKWNKEDFASLAGKTIENAGPNYKYEYDYVRLGKLIQHYIPAWRVEIEKYFSLVILNFLFSNGDAHLKNFAVLESVSGDYLLSPAYDLLCTSMHLPNESRMALDLFVDFESDYFTTNGFYGRPDFIELARRFDLPEQRRHPSKRCGADGHRQNRWGRPV